MSDVTVEFTQGETRSMAHLHHIKIPKEVVDKGDDAVMDYITDNSEDWEYIKTYDGESEECSIFDVEVKDE